MIFGASGGLRLSGSSRIFQWICSYQGRDSTGIGPHGYLLGGIYRSGLGDRSGFRPESAGNKGP